MSGLLFPHPTATQTSPLRDALTEAAPALQALRRGVATRATEVGRTESLFGGLRFYRFVQPAVFRKTQSLMPGLVAVLQGRKVARFGARTLAYNALNFLVLASEAVCDSTVVSASPREPYLALSLDLPPETLARTLAALADAHEEASGDEPDAFTAPLEAPMCDALLRLLHAADDATERRLLAPLIVEEIALRLLRSDAAAALRGAIGAARDVQQIQAAMRYMREHLASALSVQSVAGQVAMSPSHFAHRFRTIARVSPMRFLREARLAEARTLMLGSGLRAGQAALRVGYESASHFTRDFKAAYGHAPAEYMRRLRNP